MKNNTRLNDPVHESSLAVAHDETVRAYPHALNGNPSPTIAFSPPLSIPGNYLQHHAALLQTTREQERTIIARELHDEFAQVLTATKLDLHWLMRRLPDANEQIRSRLNEMATNIDEVMRKVWEIASELRPRILEEMGLKEAIRWQLQKFMERTDTCCASDIDALDMCCFAEPLQIALYRIAQEALANIARHADASQVFISATRYGSGLLEITISDNGRGLPFGKVYDTSSLGLAGMRERAGVFGGSVFFESPPNGGTIVTIRVPPQITEAEVP